MTSAELTPVFEAVLPPGRTFIFGSGLDAGEAQQTFGFFNSEPATQPELTVCRDDVLAALRRGKDESGALLQKLVTNARKSFEAEVHWAPTTTTKRGRELFLPALGQHLLADKFRVDHSLSKLAVALARGSVEVHCSPKSRLLTASSSESSRLDTALGQTHVSKRTPLRLLILPNRVIGQDEWKSATVNSTHPGVEVHISVPAESIDTRDLKERLSDRRYIDATRVQNRGRSGVFSPTEQQPPMTQDGKRHYCDGPPRILAIYPSQLLDTYSAKPLLSQVQRPDPKNAYPTKNCHCGRDLLADKDDTPMIQC
jgi:hypothetical protein